MPSVSLMRHRAPNLWLCALALVPFAACRENPPPPRAQPAVMTTSALPAPRTSGPVSLESALAKRRSQRTFQSTPLSEAELGQLLWAAQGLTDREHGFRTAPSAGALFPLQVYAATASSFARYHPDRHDLELLQQTDLRPTLYEAALRQEAVRQAPVVLVITAQTDKLSGKYGMLAARFAAQESGHAAQNVLLEAAALDLAAVPVGGFDEAQVRQALNLPATEVPLYLIPVGRR